MYAPPMMERIVTPSYPVKIEVSDWLPVTQQSPKRTRDGKYFTKPVMIDLSKPGKKQPPTTPKSTLGSRKKAVGHSKTLLSATKFLKNKKK